LAGTLPTPERALALQQMGFLLKQQEQFIAAADMWEQLAALDAGITAHVELAKYHEWRMHDPATALTWTLAALEKIAAWPPSLERQQAHADLQHRQQRLERKLA
jgi:hypothetical protein